MEENVLLIWDGSQPHSAMPLPPWPGDCVAIAPGDVDPSALEGLVACRLIPLNKNPGVRPIGVGEMLHRLVAKSVLSVVRGEITEVSGAMELCAGYVLGRKLPFMPFSECFQQEDFLGCLVC